MKTTCSQILLNLMVCFSLFTLSNCKDDCLDKKIPLKDLNTYVPYKGNDTLRFLHNSTDTQVFVGQGMERFYVSARREQDNKCSEEDQESVRIRFVNPQTQDEIKMEYVYEPTTGATHLYKFYYRNIYIGNRLKTSLLTMKINENIYNSLGIFSKDQDTLSYFLFRFPSLDNQYSGIVKVKYPGDTLTLIR